MRCRDPCLSSDSLASDTRDALHTFGFSNLNGTLPCPSNRHCRFCMFHCDLASPGLAGLVFFFRCVFLVLTPVSLAGSHKYHRPDCDPTPQQPRDHRPLIHVPGGGPLPSHPGSEYNPPVHSPTPPCWPGPSTLLTLTEGEGGLYLSPLSLLILAKTYTGSGPRPAP